MIVFEVMDMTCGHCAGTIEKAVKAVDARATVQVDLGRHLVKIEPAGADVVAIGAAISEAGYTPVAAPAA